MWVGRDKNNNLHLFNGYKPIRDEKNDKWIDAGRKCHLKLDSRLYPELNWKDEPIEVEIVPKLYRREDV